MSSILYGIGAIIDRFFGVEKFGKSSPHYRYKQSCLALSENPPSGRNDSILIADIYRRIECNWRRSRTKYKKNPSKENWRWDPHPDIDKDNPPGPEVSLERRIIQSSDETWTNQVPTSSGLTGHSFDKVRNIDLVHKLGDRQCEFIELKVNSDTPLYAAIEILTYGCLYLFSRQHLLALKYDAPKQHELLRMSRIHLGVLAPHSYYAPYAPSPGKPYKVYNLGWLEDYLNDALRQIIRDFSHLDLIMDFRFESFPPDFTWRPSQRKMPDEAIQMAVRNRQRVYSRS